MAAWQENGAGAENPSDQLTGGGFDILPAFLTMVAVLAVVVALILLVAWLLKRVSGKTFSTSGGGLFELVGTMPLGEKRMLALVKAAGKYLLLGMTNEQITLLKELEAKEVEQLSKQRQQANQGSFQSMLRGFMGRKNSGDDV